jgi:quinol monooxygenase YgiN
MANYRGCHKEEKLLFYQIKIVVKQYKRDEFVESMRSFARKIRKEKGCLEYSLCRDIEKENTYSVVGEWKTRKAVEKHFQTHDFEVFIGAARVLGETFEMNIGEVLKTGGFKLAREQMDNGILTIRGERKQEKKY